MIFAGHDQPRSRDDLALARALRFSRKGVAGVSPMAVLLHSGCPNVPLLKKKNDGRSDLEFLQVGLLEVSGKRFKGGHLFGWAVPPFRLRPGRGDLAARFAGDYEANCSP